MGSKLTIVIDFDGTIVSSKYPNIGTLQHGAKEVINKWYEKHCVVISTCRAGEHEKAAWRFLNENGIKYHYFNENPKHLIEQYGMDTRKMSGDVYFDDKAAGGFMGWEKANKYVEWMENRKPVIICVIGESGTGKCVDKNSIINVNGRLFSFEEYALNQHSNKILSHNNAFECGILYKTTSKSAIKITLRNGVYITGTPEHMIKVFDSNNGIVWRRLDAISPSDSVLFSYGQNVYPEPTKLITITPEKHYKNHSSISIIRPEYVSEDMAYLLGCISANASFGTNSIDISTYNTKIQNEIKRIVHKEFGIYAHNIYQKDKIVGLCITSSELKKFLNINGLSFDTARFKKVPSCILNSNKNIQIKYIKGLFDCDSSYYKSRLEWSTASIFMKDMVCAMLFNMGIYCIIKEKYLKKYNHTYYRIFLSSESSFTYLDLVKDYKLEPLSHVCLDTNVGILTKDFRVFIKNCLLKYSFTKSGYYRVNGKYSRVPEKYSKLKSKLYGKREVIHELFRRDGDIPEIEEACRYMLDNNVILEPVVCVENVEDFNDSVYDFHIPSNNTFICNNMINHNTTVADYIESRFAVNMIQSYTDRPKRKPTETGHTFISESEFDLLKQEDMIAWTKFGNYRYCCLKADVQMDNTYVLDEKGLLLLLANFRNVYDIYSIRVKCDEDVRLLRTGDQARIDRDRGVFSLPDRFFNFVIDTTDLELNDYPQELIQTIASWLNRGWKY